MKNLFVITIAICVASNVFAGIKLVPVGAVSGDATGPESGSYWPFTSLLVAENGTATVTRANGTMPLLILSSPTVLTLDPSGFGTGGISRVSLSMWAGFNAVTFLTNNVAYSIIPVVLTNGYTSVLFRRVGDEKFKGTGLP